MGPGPCVRVWGDREYMWSQGVRVGATHVCAGPGPCVRACGTREYMRAQGVRAVPDPTRMCVGAGPCTCTRALSILYYNKCAYIYNVCAQMGPN